MAQSSRPVIIALTSDYFIVPRLQDTADALGFQLDIVGSPREIDADGVPIARSVSLTEPLSGSDAAYIRAIVNRRPALILMDLASEDIPWERWTQVLKTSSATRRVPVIAFGPHVEAASLERAKAAGADRVVSRGKLQTSLKQLIEQHARTVDFGELSDECNGDLSDLALQGLELLNAGEYYEAHEYLEHAWLSAPELEGYLYRSLLQVAVAYLHVIRGNYAGAAKMLLRVRQWVEPLPDHCRGVDVAVLRHNLEIFSEALERGGVEGISEFDRTALRPIPLLE